MSRDVEDGLAPIANTDSDPVANILFVHGLGGASHSTWTFGKPGTADYFFWPEELGVDLTEYGIWTVGYPAGFTAMGAQGMSIEKRGGNLAQKLTNAGLTDSPIVLITHSMGGLIAKSLIVGSQAQADPDRKQLVSNIRGLVFCGTPHRGSGYAKAAGTLGKLFGGSQQHVKEMESNQDAMDLLHEKFIEWHRHSRIPILSFAESIGLFKKRWFARPARLELVVPRASANPDIAGCTVRDVGDDHLTLVKPPNRHHDVYAGVLRWLKREVFAAPPTGASELSEVWDSETVEEPPALKNRPSEPHSDADRVQSALSNTNGKSGAGKKILVIEDSPTLTDLYRLVAKNLMAEPTCAADFDTALDSIRAGTFDAVILDMQLDEMDVDGQQGLMLLDQLQAYQTDVPVIIISALPWSGEQVRDFLLRYGAFDYIKKTKPMSPDSVASVVEKALKCRNR